MDWQHPIKGKVQSPDNATEADNDQRTVHEGTEANFTELSGDAALKNIADGVERWVIGIPNKV